MTDERDAKLEVETDTESKGVIVCGAWSSGWMMGIGFGTLVMFIAEDLPNFYERFRFMLAGAGILAFVWGFVRARKAGLVPWLFQGGLILRILEREKDPRRGDGD